MCDPNEVRSNKILTRRSFLEGSLLSGAAIIASQLGPRTAHASDSLERTGTVPTYAVGNGDILSLAPAGSIAFSGWVGERITACLNQRVMVQNISDVVQPFHDRLDGDGGWRGEFWGKWFTSACLGYSYQPTPEHRVVLDKAFAQLVETQSPSGYIGTCDDRHQLASWDIWGRKYVLLGLVAYYDQTGNKDALAAARREADFLMTQVGPGKANITEACLDLLKGLPSSSILEPMTLLYSRTQDSKYLSFAKYIVASWTVPTKSIPKGMRLVEDALANVPPLKIDSPKGYEMMSCFEGLCELFRVTGEAQYKDAAIHFGNSIVKTELMVNGSCSNQELWCNGAVSQTSLLEQPQETCVTTTWMKFCCQLLRLTGDPQWADQMEVSLYNSLAGAMMPKGDWWAYFSPIIGQRVPSNIQYQSLSCCVANGPRALLLTPKWAVMESATGPVVNLYAPSRATSKLPDGSSVVLTQTTDYPVTGRVRIVVDPEKGRHFELKLRIPSWSAETALAVNGKSIFCTAGKYASIARVWSPGDIVELSLDLSGRAVPAPSGAPQFAVMRGPILLALDNRFVQEQETAVHLLIGPGGRIDLTTAREKSDEVWMAFEVSFEVRPSHFFNHHKLPLTLVDFASAGNRWSDDNLFRAWLPQPLYLADAYPAHTWKLMYPDQADRPTKPLTRSFSATAAVSQPRCVSLTIP